MSEPDHYLYLHKDPRTKELLYIGRGSRSAARMYSMHNRGESHRQRLLELVAAGYPDTSWAKQVVGGLSSESVGRLEKACIALLDPMFNVHYTPATLVRNPDGSQYYRGVLASYSHLLEPA